MYKTISASSASHAKITSHEGNSLLPNPVQQQQPQSPATSRYMKFTSVQISSPQLESLQRDLLQRSRRSNHPRAGDRKINDDHGRCAEQCCWCRALLQPTSLPSTPPSLAIDSWELDQLVIGALETRSGVLHPRVVLGASVPRRVRIVGTCHRSVVRIAIIALSFDGYEL